MRIGIFGGSFDPVHKGHLFLAFKAQKDIGLDRVIFVPARVPPHMKLKKLASPEHRMRMLKTAISGFPGFTASDIELRKEGMSYTIETIRHFKKEFGPGNQYFFLCGTDNIEELPYWKECGTLIQECNFIFYGRNGCGKTAIDRLKNMADARTLKTLKKRFLDGVMINISSTEIRRRLRSGEDTKRDLPLKVWEYIMKNRLYAKH